MWCHVPVGLSPDWNPRDGANDLIVAASSMPEDEELFPAADVGMLVGTEE
jgi:hypothetical protein